MPEKQIEDGSDLLPINNSDLRQTYQTLVTVLLEVIQARGVGVSEMQLGGSFPFFCK